MADIRIKDLTTEVSSTATGDFFVIDGTTGTRKTPAFNPTFGGNATVTGTLTVNGTGSSLVATTTPFAVSTGVTVASGGFGVGAVGTGGSFFVNTPSANSGFSSGLAIDGSYPGGIGSQSVINIKAFGVMSGGGYGSTLSFQTTLNGTFNEVMRMTSDKQVSILGTNSSTSTSSGALVVGNGTSGGLGVGGAINAGGAITAGGNIQCNAVYASNNTTLYLRPQGATVSSGEAQLTTTGNLTLAGTLTANGATGTFGSSASSGTSLKVISGVGTLASPKYSTLDFRTYNDSGTGAYIRTGNRQSDTNEWLLEIAARSNADVLTSVATFGASGTTFTGPLTSGNVVKSANSAAANGTEFIALRAEVGADATLGPALVTIGALPSATGASRYGFIASYDNNDWRTLYLGGSPGVAANGGQVRVPANISSTSTSSGALVVSGGVGVAGSQYLGVKLNISTHTGDAGGIGFGTETNLYRYQAGGLALDHASGAAPGFLFRENGTSTLRLESNSGVGYLSTLTSANLILRTNATTALTLDTSQNAIFAGTIRTAAPVGGTAASWKLGTVATVSPTSPNRTIEVDIGGTIYYIHAKTTNN